MYLTDSDEQTKLRLELREYFASIMTPRIKHELRNGPADPDATAAYREVVRSLGEAGWLGIGWPVVIGGQGRSTVEQTVFNEEATYAEVPTPLLTINSVGPVIAAYGTDDQKEIILKGILRGEIHFAIGYSEAESGTDLASLRTRAERVGDEYVINGQKLWTGMMEAADYIWLAVRTDPGASKHRGISVMLVPRHAEGISSTRLNTLGSNSIAAVSFENVRVPVENCMGGENNGWAMMTGQLNSERVALVPSANVARSLAVVTGYAGNTMTSNGNRLIDEPWVKQNLARVKSELEVLKLMNGKLATDADSGNLAPADASAAKVFGSELMGRAQTLLNEIVGPDIALSSDAPGHVLGGQFAKRAGTSNVMTFIGGVNEIQRDLIAQLGLGLPRSNR